MRIAQKLPAVCLLAALAGTMPGCGPRSAPPAETVHSYRIDRTTESCTVDGRLSESFWTKSAVMDGFRVDADPQKKSDAATSVRVVYSGDALMVAFECAEPLLGEVTAQTPDDAGALVKDNCELLVFSRPETPYYSPFLQRLDYMNANDFVRTQRRFLVDPNGGKIESNIYKTGPHTPYITDDAWVGPWECAVSRAGNSYTVEISIPWSTIGGLPQKGHDFRLHFVRRRSAGSGELQSFDWCKSENVYAPSFDPADFNQEHPLIFAHVTFYGDHAELNRYIETEAPWKVVRTRTTYEEVLTSTKDPFRATHFYLNISGFLLPDSIRAKYDDATWKKEQENFIIDIGRTGVNGPFLPGFLNSVGVSGLDSLYAAYGMRFSYHGSASAAQAKKEGAKIMRPRGTPAFFDPVFSRLKNESLGQFLQKYGTERWLFDIRGQDEPFNEIASILQPGTYEWANSEIKAKYGVELNVPMGVPAIPYQNQVVQENSRTVPDDATALSRIAMFRWLNGVYRDTAAKEYATSRKYAPSKLFEAYNRNAVADMDFLDQSGIHTITDYYSADPYPSFCCYVYGGARSRYHVGFTSKWVTDLAAGKPTQMIVQGCDMIQRYSTPENVREWASQAAKAGVSMIDWWGTPKLDHPDLYREMLRLSNLWMQLPMLNIPETEDIGVIFSDDSRAGAGDEGLHGHYTLHVILGEKLGAWFRIVSENHVRKALHTLDGKKLFIAPELKYVSREFADNLYQHVDDGATLVLLDPDAFRHDIETGSLADFRMKFLGLGDPAKRSADRMIATEAGKKRFGATGDLPLRPIRIAGDTMNARTIRVPEGAEVLFTYPDGQPAAYSRKVGKGEVIVFGAMPFEDSELAITDSGWDIFFASLIDSMSIERNQPIWDFMFPATGGEVQMTELLVK